MTTIQKDGYMNAFRRPSDVTGARGHGSANNTYVWSVQWIPQETGVMREQTFPCIEDAEEWAGWQAAGRNTMVCLIGPGVNRKVL